MGTNAPQRWTGKEEALGRRLLEEMKAATGDTFLMRANSASEVLGYGRYADIPQGTKSFISFIGGRSSGMKKRGNRAKNSASPSSEKPPPASYKERWFMEALASKSMRHGLHPQDEADLLEYLERAQADA